MKTNYNLEDYAYLYHERAGIIEESGIIRNIANAKAWDEVFKIFKQNECPCDEEIGEFRRKVK